MEEKKKIKISLKTAIILVVMLLIIIAIIVVLILNFNKMELKSAQLAYLKYDKMNLKNTELVPTKSNAYKEIDINGKVYYQKLNEHFWYGQYREDNFYTNDSWSNRIDIMEVVSYKKYLDIINKINRSNKGKQIQQYYLNENCNYIILANNNIGEMTLIDCFKEDDKIIIYGDEKSSSVGGFLIVIPTNMPIETEIEYRECYSSSEISNLQEYGTPYEPAKHGIDPGVIDYKPIIYLYPTVKTELTVKLGYSDKVTCSYPKYMTGWNVLAKPNGDLIDLDTNKNLYALYYESQNVYNFKVEKDGFVVKGTDVTEFLEEKLKILGLTEREAEEFIVYWLPKLQENEYNYIRFATMEEINENMPLEFSVEPDNLIRVLMTYKGLDRPIDVEEQQLQTPKRTGFVAVEWGGTEIK